MFNEDLISLVVIFLFSTYLTLLISSIISTKKKKVQIFGKPPINHKIYAFTGFSTIICWLAILVKAIGFDLRYNPTPIPNYISLPAIIFLAIGFIIVLISYLNLGESGRFGIPREKTHLKTEGLYSISRNPMYIGFNLINFAASFYTLNAIIFIIASINALLYHKIILAEEEYLEIDLGKKYKEYRDEVRRYV